MYIKNNAFENQIFDHFRKTQKTIDDAVKLLKDKETQKRLSSNIRKMAMPDASDIIADEIIKLME